MNIINKDVIQSYLITAARYDFNVEEKRILYRLVEACQFQLEGKKLKEGFVINKNLFGDYIVEIPTSSFLSNDESNNHTRVKEALKRLRNKTIEIEDEKEWKLIGIIEKPKFEKRGIAKFEVQPEIYEAILNFSKGFRKYELKTAMSFDSAYTMRFYELFSEKKEPITYSIDNLKIMFHLEGKYKLTTEFLKYTVDVAMKELEKKAPFSFTYAKNCIGKKVVSLRFFPYEIPSNRDEVLEHKELQKQVSVTWDLDKMIVDYLKQNYFFEKDEIKNNIETFKQAQKELDLMDFLSKKRRYCSSRDSPKGSLIAALKKELKAKQSEKNN